MRVTKNIRISNINVDRYSISPETLKLIDFIRKNGVSDLPPIKLQRLETGSFKLKDGRHRITAFKMLGIKEIKSQYYQR